MDRIQLAFVNTLLKFSALYMGCNLTSRSDFETLPHVISSLHDTN